MEVNKAIPRNLATWDRVLRVVVGIGLLVWWGALDFHGFWRPILGVALLVNAAMGRCGAYALLGLSTCPVKKPPTS